MTRKIMAALLVVLLLMQFIRPSKNKADELSAAGIDAIVKVPGDVQNFLQDACYDCHSNNTHYPWYANIQPLGWWLAHHVKEGKQELNLSEFGSYSTRRQISKLNAIAHSVKDGSMPLGTYSLMHRQARLSELQKEALIRWASAAADSLRQQEKLKT